MRTARAAVACRLWPSAHRTSRALSAAPDRAGSTPSTGASRPACARGSGTVRTRGPVFWHRVRPAQPIAPRPACGRNGMASERHLDELLGFAGSCKQRAPFGNRHDRVVGTAEEQDRHRCERGDGMGRAMCVGQQQPRNRIGPCRSAEDLVAHADVVGERAVDSKSTYATGATCGQCCHCTGTAEALAEHDDAVRIDGRVTAHVVQRRDRVLMLMDPGARRTAARSTIGDSKGCCVTTFRT
jgi:hypothetical protein